MKYARSSKILWKNSSNNSKFEFVFIILENVNDAIEETRLLPRGRLQSSNKRNGKSFNATIEKRITVLYEVKENDTNEIKENDTNEAKEVRKFPIFRHL